MTETRRLAAVMFTDIAGYTKLMAKDEQRAMDILKKNREIQILLAEKHNGELLKEMGDGTLLCFKSTLDAIRFGQEIQQQVKNDPDLNLRIGIHLGDIIFKGGDVFGDGVNVASRIEVLAEPGEICISDPVHSTVKNRADIIAVYLGKKKLKHVEHPVKIYKLACESHSSKRHPITRILKRMTANRPLLIGVSLIIIAAIVTIKIPILKNISIIGNRTSSGLNANKPSIAVLPLVTDSNSQEQEYFGDGLAEDIINALAHVKNLRVIGRTSAFSYKGKNIDVRKIGRELQVKTVLEGNVRMISNKLSISIQLLSCESGDILWSDKYTEELDDIFSVQDKIALTIVEKLRIELLHTERDRLLKHSTNSGEAYQYYLQGRFFFQKHTYENYIKSIKLFKKAIEIDPNYTQGYLGLAKVYTEYPFHPYPEIDNIEELALRAVLKAMELDNNLADAYITLAMVKEMSNPLLLRESEQNYQKALNLDPQNVDALHYYGHILSRTGSAREGYRMMEQALRLDPLSSNLNGCMIESMLHNGEPEKAIAQALKNEEMYPGSSLTKWWLGWAYMEGGFIDKAIAYFNTFDDNEIECPFNRQANLTYAYAINGQQDSALYHLARLREINKTVPIDPWNFAVAFSGMGEIDSAVTYIQKTAYKKFKPVIFLKTFPPFKQLHNNKRYKTLLDSLGLNVKLKGHSK